MTKVNKVSDRGMWPNKTRAESVHAAVTKSELQKGHQNMEAKMGARTETRNATIELKKIHEIAS